MKGLVRDLPSKVPGLAIGVVKNNKVVFKKGYGFTSTLDNFPVTTETIFPLSW